MQIKQISTCNNEKKYEKFIWDLISGSFERIFHMNITRYDYFSISINLLVLYKKKITNIRDFQSYPCLDVQKVTGLPSINWIW